MVIITITGNTNIAQVFYNSFSKVGIEVSNNIIYIINTPYNIKNQKYN